MTMQLDENSAVAGVLMGSGLREISQLFGLSRKRSGSGATSPDGAQPSGAQMSQGNIGDIDRLMLLAKMQGQAPGAMPPGAPGQVPGMTPPGPMPLAPSPLGAPPVPPGGPAAPLSQPGAPLPLPPGGGAPSAPPNPLMAALGNAAPGGGMSGGLPMQLLQQLLQGSAGLV